MKSNESTIGLLSHDINDLPNKNSLTLFKGGIYPRRKEKNNSHHHHLNLTVLTPEVLDTSICKLVPISLLTLSSPQSCKHISNLCKKLITNTCSSYPTSLLETSAKEYCKKRSNELNLYPNNSMNEIVISNPSLRYLEINDIIISVSHCHDCHRHKMTLSHKENEYIKFADDILRESVKFILELHLNVRVCVIRHQSDILGAFEVVITSNSRDEGLQSEVLHSKVISKRWPSKSVFKKRLISFVNKQAFEGYDDSDFSSQQISERNDGLASYKVGRINSLDEIPFSDPSWNYETVRKEAIRTGRISESEYSEDLFNDVNNEGKLVNVIYAFDCRQVGTIQVGSIVEVMDVSNPRGCQTIERHPLIGEVLLVEENYLSILLKYFCAPTNHDYDRVKLIDTSRYSALDDIPVELEALFLIIRKKVAGDFNRWALLDDNDKEVDGFTYLTRKSLFHQFRNIIYDIEVENETISHPTNEAQIDLQLCYNEKILNWIFDCIGENDNSINMYKLELVVICGDIFAFENEMKKVVAEAADEHEKLVVIDKIDNEIILDNDVMTITSIILEILESVQLRNQ